MKVGLLQFFFKKPFAKDINKQHKQQGGRCVLFLFFFFLLLVKRGFPQEGKQTEEWTLNTTGSEMILNQSHLLFFIDTDMTACITSAVITF